MMHVLYLGPPDTLEYVRTNLPERFEVHWALEETEVARVIQRCDVVLDAYLQVRFSAERIAQAQRLKLFVTASTGSDHIDASSLSQRAIPLLTLKGQTQVLRNITSTAEHSWLLLLACARQLRAAMQGVLAGAWERNRYPGIMLKGKTLGVVGCGRIGQWMAHYGTAFGMRCVGYDPYISPWPEHIERTDLRTVLSQSDFITVHVPFNEETRCLLGPEEFALIQPTAVLINTSRGGVIDEGALVSALREGRLASAGLDVLSGEPEIATHPLVAYAKDHDNLVITPHIGGFSPDALRPVLAFSCQRIVDYFTHGDGRTRHTARAAAR